MATAAAKPLGPWYAEHTYAVDVLRSVVDPRSVIEVRANDAEQAMRIAEMSGYRVYSASIFTGAAL